MSLVTDWLVPQRVVRNVIQGAITIDELTDGAEAGRQFVKAGTPLVHDIIDMRFMSNYPTNLRKIISATSVFGEPNLGWVILIAESRIIRFLASTTIQFYGARFRAFETPEDALAFLQSQDVTLPELPEYVLPGEPDPV